MSEIIQRRSSARLRTAGVLCSLTLAALSVAAAQENDTAQPEESLLKQLLEHPNTQKGTATFPIIFCWYKGQPALYIRTEASDPAAAAMQSVNLVPRLSNTINAPNGAVDDIYQFTNFTQGNVIPSAPIPAGPKNSDPNYTPLWQVTLVTWKSGTFPTVLKSEEAILAALGTGQVTLQKTNIVVNCPVIYTPQGGKLPLVKIHLKDDDDRDRN